MIKNVFLIVFLALMAFASVAGAEVSKFRKDFADAYRQDKFDGLAYLVRKNKDIIPAEVRGIIKDASAAEKTYPERMELLDLANTMASMYKHWHNDETLLAEVEKVQREEVKKENERQAEIEKWASYEKFLGNFVMRTKQKEMDAKGVAPVIYPHWSHRLYFDCKVCHTGLFTMQRGANNINHAAFNDSKLCGACHNGTVAFASDKDCERCHVIGKPGEEALKDLSKLDLNRVKDTAAKLGGSFIPEKLPNGKIPLDKLGSIDWAAMKESKAYAPATTLKGVTTDVKDEKRDTEILFASPMPYIKDVVFSHKTHTDYAKCSACHQDVFKDTLGGNEVTMAQMSQGKFCAACHGKVSFKLADCNRCHTRKNGEPAGSLLIRKK